MILAKGRASFCIAMRFKSQTPKTQRSTTTCQGLRFCSQQKPRCRKPSCALTVVAFCRVLSSFKWALTLKYRCCKSWFSQNQVENTTIVRFFFLPEFIPQCYACYLVSDSHFSRKERALQRWDRKHLRGAFTPSFYCDRLSLLASPFRRPHELAV